MFTFEPFHRLWPVLLCGLIGMSINGCAFEPLLRYQPDAPVTVNLPIANAGVRDERDRFAALFARELGARDRAELKAWLHGVPANANSRDGFVDSVERRFAERRAGTSVLIVPGLFGDCLGDQSVPFGDGVQRTVEAEAVKAYDQYRELGLKSIRMIRLPGRASSARNGRLVAEAVRTESARPGVERIVLLAYSKGVADSLQALDELATDGSLPTQLVALVSVAGVVMGTPIADSLESLYALLSPMVSPLNCTESQGDELASVTRRERSAWLLKHAPPARLSYYSVVAHADIEQIAPPLRGVSRMLAASDPLNDGQVIVSDAILPGSELLATARSDHWDVALPRDRHPNILMRSFGSGRAYPREALFRALITWAVAQSP